MKREHRDDPEAARAEKAAAYENERPEVQELVPPEATRILDLGCASGALGAALKRRGGVQVVGIERDPEYAAAAALRLDRVVTADLNELLADRAACERLGRFDCLIAADVLEHLYDPWSALRAAVGLLEPGSAAVISLPNVRFWQTFYELGLKGTWPRRGAGLFDRTHLHWFALGDAYDLIRHAGLELELTTRQYALFPSGSRHYPLSPQAERRWSRRLGRWKLRGFVTLQYVLRARKPA